MKREDITKIFGEEADKDKVTALLDAFHAEIKTHKDATEQAKADTEAAKSDLAAKMKELEEASAKAGSVEDLQKSLKELQDKYDTDTKAASEKLENALFDSAIDNAIRDAKGKSVKAIRAHLDIEALKKSKNQQADIQAAIKALAEAEDSAWMFGPPDPKPTGEKKNVGGKTDGKPPEGADDPESLLDAINQKYGRKNES